MGNLPTGASSDLYAKVIHILHTASSTMAVNAATCLAYLFAIILYALQA
jgi:fructose-1-phosphate kinase PfkB-like protein